MDIIALLDADAKTASAVVRQLGAARGTRGVTAAMLGVLHHSGDVRLTAIGALGAQGSRAAWVALLLLQASEDPDIRMWSAEALCNYPGRRTEQALLRALKDEYARVRMCAAEALACVGTERSIAALTAALDDSSPIVRMWVGSTLTLMRIAKQSRGKVRRAVSERLSKERFGAARATMYAALYRLGESSALPRLLALARSQSLHTWWVAIGMLRDLACFSHLSPPDASRVLDHLNHALQTDPTAHEASHIIEAINAIQSVVGRGIDGTHALAYPNASRL